MIGCGVPEVLSAVLFVMSLDMEDYPPSGFIDGFRVVEHVPGQDFSAEAFKKREAPHAPFLFAVRSITPRTLETLRREGVLPDSISDREFSCIHRVHSGTLISYMSRLVVRDAAKEGLECGTECLSITTDLEHAEALVDQNFVEGRLQVVYRIRVPVDDEILTARALLRSDPDTISIIEAALARAHTIQSPVRVVNSRGRPFHKGRGRREALRLIELFETSVARQPQFLNCGTTSVQCFGRQIDVPCFQTGAMSSSELKYCWWHREAHLRRHPFGIGLWPVALERVYMTPPFPPLTASQRLYGARHDIRRSRLP